MSERAPYLYLRSSNALTYASLLAGLLAVAAAADLRSWNASGALIALSVVLDTFDGRFARLFSRGEDEAAFGVELDSLTDAVVFGFVPAACLYLLTDFDSAAASLGWAGAALAYLVSALTRLGCYNLHQAREDRFVGVPTTLAALLLSTLFFARPSASASALALAALAAAMVAPIPVPRPRGRAFAVFAAWILLVLAWHSVRGARELGRPRDVRAVAGEEPRVPPVARSAAEDPRSQRGARRGNAPTGAAAEGWR